MRAVIRDLALGPKQLRHKRCGEQHKKTPKIDRAPSRIVFEETTMAMCDYEHARRIVLFSVKLAYAQFQRQRPGQAAGSCPNR